MKKSITVLAICGLLLNACAWVSVKPVKPTDTETNGFRYYDTKPLLVVTDTNTQVIFVPNYSRAYSLSFGAFMSKHDITLETKDGTFFTKIDDKQDPAEFLKGLVALGQDAIKAAGQAAKAASDPVAGKLVALYDFVFDANGVFQKLNKIYP